MRVSHLGRDFLLLAEEAKPDAEVRLVRCAPGSRDGPAAKGRSVNRWLSGRHSAHSPAESKEWCARVPRSQLIEREETDAVPERADRDVRKELDSRGAKTGCDVRSGMKS